MIDPQQMVEGLAVCGYDTVVTVPCSSIASLLCLLDASKPLVHISATSEAEAVGIATGAYLAGRKPILIMQNSGFCDALNVIGSLLDPFSVPLSFLVTGRGGFGIKDEPQHRLVGKNFFLIAEAFEIPVAVLSPLPCDLVSQLCSLSRSAQVSGKGAVLLIPVGMISNSNRCVYPSERLSYGNSSKIDRVMLRNPSRRSVAVRAIRNTVPDSVFVATTGYTGRELFASGDIPSNLYLAGSMGCASAVGLGIALFGKSAVVVLDGDGAMLMRMGNCATIAAQKPSRFVHVVLNNGVYASTGAQPTLGQQVDLAAIAHACGYKKVIQTDDYSYAADLIKSAADSRITSPLFIDLWVSSDEEPCPRTNVGPASQTLRLRQFLNGSSKKNN